MVVRQPWCVEFRRGKRCSQPILCYSWNVLFWDQVGRVASKSEDSVRDTSGFQTPRDGCGNYSDIKTDFHDLQFSSLPTAWGQGLYQGVVCTRAADIRLWPALDGSSLQCVDRRKIFDDILPRNSRKKVSASNGWRKHILALWTEADWSFRRRCCYERSRHSLTRAVTPSERIHHYEILGRGEGQHKLNGNVRKPRESLKVSWIVYCASICSSVVLKHEKVGSNCILIRHLYNYECGDWLGAWVN